MFNRFELVSLFSFFFLHSAPDLGRKYLSVVQFIFFFIWLSSLLREWNKFWRSRRWMHMLCDFCDGGWQYCRIDNNESKVNILKHGALHIRWHMACGCASQCFSSNHNFSFNWISACSPLGYGIAIRMKDDPSTLTNHLTVNNVRAFFFICVSSYIRVPSEYCSHAVYPSIQHTTSMNNNFVPFHVSPISPWTRTSLHMIIWCT